MQNVTLEDIKVIPMNEDYLLDIFHNKWFYYNRMLGEARPDLWKQINKSVRMIPDFVEKKYFEPLVFEVSKGQVGNYLFFKVNVPSFQSDEEKILFTKICRFIFKIEKQANADNELNLTPYFQGYSSNSESNGLFLMPMFKLEQ